MRFRLDAKNINRALRERLKEIDDIPFDIERLFAMEYNSAMSTIFDVVGRSEMVSWSDFSTASEKHIELLWIAREIILAISLAEGAKRLPEHVIYANIMGSTAILSDIDVTIESLVASRFIQIVEELWDAHPWFNHTLWKVDLYGDFVMIGDFYMNMSLLSNDVRMQLFELAAASYFRHVHCDTFDHDILHKLLNMSASETQTSQLIRNGALLARTISAMSSKEQRKDYYELLAAAEYLHDEIAKTDVARDSTAAGADIIGRILIALARANLYREENYVIPSTVIHIVRIEQAKNSDNAANTPDFDGSCDLLLTRIAKCSLDSRAYIMSAIEQLGYLQQALADKRMITAGKYFGRLVRAISALDDSYGRWLNLDALRAASALAAELAAEKRGRRRSVVANSDVLAGRNLYDIAKSIFAS